MKLNNLLSLSGSSHPFWLITVKHVPHPPLPPTERSCEVFGLSLTQPARLPGNLRAVEGEEQRALLQPEGSGQSWDRG